MVIFGNDKAAPEFVKSTTSVWWDMDTCPVPEGYDARRVRPSIEAALKNLGYMGPVIISAMGDLEKIPAQVLQGLSSTGIAVQHAHSSFMGLLLFDDTLTFKSLNPPPATIMIISDKVEAEMARALCMTQQSMSGYNLVLASTYPTGQNVSSCLYTTAEWLWKTILGDNQQVTRRFFLPRCSELGESGDSAPFFCRSCEFTGANVTDLTDHLSTDKHKQEEIDIIESRKPDPMRGYRDERPKGKANRRLRMGFRTFHVLLTKRRSRVRAQRVARRSTP